MREARGHSALLSPPDACGLLVETIWMSKLPPEEWLLIEWPTGESEPTKYCLATLSADSRLTELEKRAKHRWIIERDYEELKQELGLGNYKGRGWGGFHHHATLLMLNASADVLQNTPPPIHTLVPELDQRVAEITDRLLSKEPARRLRPEELRAILSGERIQSRPWPFYFLRTKSGRGSEHSRMIELISGQGPLTGVYWFSHLPLAGR